MKVAKADIGGQRLVVDYDLLSEARQNLTLQGDTTYFVTSLVYKYYQRADDRRGAVINATRTPAREKSAWSVQGSNIICQTGPYRPAVFTSMYDGSVGASIATGTPTVAGTYLNFSSCKAHKQQH